jgi:uncharacterized OB-fold protein
MNGYQKPLPQPSHLTHPFWDGVRRHELLVQRCSSCGMLRHIPKPWCPDCLSQQFTWAPMNGAGHVYSYTVMHRAPASSFNEELPYVVALVQLDEGVRMISNIVGCSPEDVHIGMPVNVIYEDVTDEISLFKFAPRR